ncbi:MAG: LytR C-terminal domain-containing protein [Candidatus Roizmanbacteria bacterium]
MLEQTRQILYVRETTISLVNVRIDKEPHIQQVYDFHWSVQTLSTVLPEIKQLINSPVRILLSEPFAYITHIELPANIPVIRQAVQQKAQELIPEDISTLLWDYKEVLLIQDSPQDIGKKIAQIMCISQHMNESIIKPLNLLGVAVDSIEPLSYAFAQYTKPEQKNILTVYKENISLLVFTCRGLVYATDTFSDDLFAHRLEVFTAYIKDTLKLTIDKISFFGQVDTGLLDTTKHLNIETEMDVFNPVIGLALRDYNKPGVQTLIRLKPENRKVSTQPGVMVQPIIQTTPEQQVPTSPNISPPISELKKITPPVKIQNPFTNFGVVEKKPILIWMVIGIIIILIGGGALYFFVPKNDIKNPVSNKADTVSPSKASSPSPEPTIKVDLLQYTISVKNASGVTGEAAKLKATLVEKGFNVTDTGNASKTGLKVSEVIYSDKVVDQYKSELEMLIKDIYTDVKVASGSPSNTDVQILIGK